MTTDSTAPFLAPRTLRIDPDTRLLLFAMRRMAGNGLDDAHAASAFLTSFGKGYRRPLILLRALMADIASGSRQTLAVAPGCCSRVTRDEATLLRIVATCNSTPSKVMTLLADLLGTRAIGSVFAHASALNAAFSDLGHPLRLEAPTA